MKLNSGFAHGGNPAEALRDIERFIKGHGGMVPARRAVAPSAASPLVPASQPRVCRVCGTAFVLDKKPGRPYVRCAKCRGGANGTN